MAARILVVEDEPGLRLALADRLRSEGYDVESSADGQDAFERACREGFDLIVLDVMLPGKNGFDVCRDLRQRGVEVPILLLTARSHLTDRVVGLKLGADDYVTKPFKMAELLARVEARLRRRTLPTDSGRTAAYRFGTILVDVRKAEVTRAGRPVELAANEFKLLRYLIEHSGATLSRDELLNEVWGYNAMPSTRTVDVHIAGLRSKLEACPSTPEFILTIRGLGYKFVG
jgi:two-component system, OmpR family, alkaline phosphatase synthesis response regulator PhoP